MLINPDLYDAIEERLTDILPHGAGIDGKWLFSWQKNGTLKCTNFYHCMNDNGYYDGFADFTIKIESLKSMRAFTLQFNGDTAQYLNKKYQLREFLEDSFYHAFPDDKSLYSLSLDILKEGK